MFENEIRKGYDYLLSVGHTPGLPEVNLDNLAISDPHWCILGQLGAALYNGAAYHRVLGIIGLSFWTGCAHGFNVKADDDDTWDYEKQSDILTNEWREFLSIERYALNEDNWKS